MPNPTKGIPVDLDKERHLRYSLGAMKDIEDKFGSLDQVSGVGDTIYVIWRGLVHEDEDLTEDDVAEMVDGENLGDVMDAVARAFGGDPDAVDVSAEGNATPEEPTG